LKSPNYLELVIDAERNMSPDMAGRFADACGLKEDPRATSWVWSRSVRRAHWSSAIDTTRDSRVFQRYRNAHKLDLAHDGIIHVPSTGSRRACCACMG
jgi:hypothetical protein